MRTCPRQIELVGWVFPTMIAMLVPWRRWWNFTGAVAKGTVAVAMRWAARKQLCHALVPERRLRVTDIIQPFSVKGSHLKVVACNLPSQPTVTSPTCTLSSRTCGSDPDQATQRIPRESSNLKRKASWPDLTTVV